MAGDSAEVAEQAAAARAYVLPALSPPTASVYLASLSSRAGPWASLLGSSGF